MSPLSPQGGPCHTPTEYQQKDLKSFQIKAGGVEGPCPSGKLWQALSECFAMLIHPDETGFYEELFR